MEEHSPSITSKLKYYAMLATKNNVEFVAYTFCTILTVFGTGLLLAGLFVPYWYEVEYIEGIVIYKVDVGLWQDRVCPGLAECEHYWTNGGDRHDKVSMPSGALIKWFETVGTAIALVSMGTLVVMWVFRKSRPVVKNLSHTMYFAPCMVAAFLSVVGTLILASKGDQEQVNWAPFLSGIGGALLFLSGCLSCVICRYDPSYGTLENPVSPKYIISQ